MPHKIIVVGDTTDHGGKVISGSSVHAVDGIPIARLGIVDPEFETVV